MARIARGIAFTLAVAIAAVTLGPVCLRLFFHSMTEAPPDAERGFAFVALGGVIALACLRHRDLFIVILLAVAFAALLKAGQNFVPGRHGRMHDFLIKALAVILGVAAVWTLKRVRGLRGG